MKNKALREGYTTGSCAAAASWAAASDLLSGNTVSFVTITLPNGSRAGFAAEKVDVPFCCYRVKKDAGDDPDVTDGVFVYASCRMMGQDFKTQEEEYNTAGGKGYLMGGNPLIYIDGGPGIGTVKREGLPCPVGHAAINPVPRLEIVCAVRDACRQCAAEGADIPDKLLITISVPEGEKIAKRTFNPRLGISGGISVLGTSGIVRPMSEEAMLDTIRLELHMRAVSGKREVILTPGNYGETFLKEKFNIPVGTAVSISNFVKDSVLMAADEGFKGLMLAGHLGKLIKVAAGSANTHSRYGDKRMETFLSVFDELPALRDMSGKFHEKIINANTTDEALRILSGAFPGDPRGIQEAFLDRLAMDIKCQLDDWLNGRLLTEVVVFSREGATGATEGVKDPAVIERSWL